MICKDWITLSLKNPSSDHPLLPPVKKSSLNKKTEGL